VDTRGENHAVVVGGSLAGLLAARVLSDLFPYVTIVDRDDLPTEAVHRRGVPQSRHTHGLLARGCQIIENLLPGFGADLVALGAVRADIQRDAIWYNDGFKGRRQPSDMVGLLASRPLIESYVRSRVADLPGVTILARTEALGLTATEGQVSGVRLAGPDGVVQLDAHVVVDATGRSNRGPAWLAELGYPAIPEESVNARIVYSTREYRRVPGAQDFVGLIAAHHPANPVGTGTAAQEGDRWMVTLLGLHDDPPPTTPGDFEEYAARIAPELYELVTTAEPLTDPVQFRIGPSVRRRYERCPTLPEGFVAIGDSLCCFNPAYGQGMTTAAAAADWLRTCLREGLDGLTRRYFTGVTKIVDVPWDITVGADLRFPQVEGERTGRVKLLNAYLARVHRAATRDAVVAGTFLRVANFLVPPPALMAPGMLWRVWRGRRGVPKATPARSVVPAVRS
jgi:2-polyprenyl-6-methoxyphenol hydroxylase-like FAD-dependent oxidoreductase